MVNRIYFYGLVLQGELEEGRVGWGDEGLSVREPCNHWLSFQPSLRWLRYARTRAVVRVQPICHRTLGAKRSRMHESGSGSPGYQVQRVIGPGAVLHGQ
ncbi:hypothetical protein AG1IA_08732 [Rhizoctonia solani AG-1 IA]|uniref:Uncharacterized protein n=1 Tax=Thanatephorus cucumeris (strain AG1-IA) TaxID=983506 RepID=L8WKG2_THACA|nr:hypothetical protein AG1IA_08732 [Rhizoctonia solani AG-1 IA]